MHPLTLAAVWLVVIAAVVAVDRGLAAPARTRPAWRRNRAQVGGTVLALAAAAVVVWWVAAVDPIARWITAWLATLALTVAAVTYAIGFSVGVAVESGRWAHRTLRRALRRHRRPRPDGLGPSRDVPTEVVDFTVDGVTTQVAMPARMVAELRRRAASPP